MPMLEMLHNLGSRIRNWTPLERQTWFWGMIERLWQAIFTRLSANVGFATHINDDVFRLEYDFASRYDRFDKRQYEPVFYLALTKEIKAGMCVVDIGAHIGMLTLAAAKRVGPTGRVYAFEPAQESVRILRRHVEFNKWNERIEVVQAVVSDQNGRLPFYVYGASMAASLSRTNVEVLNSERRTSPVSMVEVPSVTLDTFCKEHKFMPDVIKVDVEGAELLVLRGAQNLLLDISPVVLCEIHPAQMQNCGSSVLELYAFLEEVGYALQAIDEPNPMGIFHARLTRAQTLPATGA